MTLAPGQLLCHYRLVEKIGEGGMGVVWKAIDTTLDRQIAIKILPEAFATDPDRLARFGREARALAAINHPNIVTIYSVEQDEGIHFFTMELVEGLPLTERIPADGLPVESFVDMAASLANALAAAHERGLVHRDLKPSNILVSGQRQLKIVDFGLAKILKQQVENLSALSQAETAIPQMTREGVLLGTVAYMSPEQAEGKPIDHRTDIFSLGTVLYEMATGRRPFTGDSNALVISSILRHTPPAVTDLNEAMPRTLAPIIRRCLEKDLDRRYESMETLREELESLRASVLSAAGSPTAGGSEHLPSIAVLPFADMSPGKDQEYFCEGIAEELIDSLTKLKGLQVAARTSAFQLSAKGYDIREIGRQLQVRTVLEGSVRKAGNLIRITAQLVNVADGFHLWSEKYDRDLDDIFAIQDEISLAIVEKLRVRLLGDERDRLVKRFTRDLEAHSLHLRGQYFWNRRYELDLRKALDHFKLAVDKDPRYALPYVGIANCYGTIGLYGFLPPQEAFTRARAAANEALAIDDTLGEAYTALGWAAWAWDWNWKVAEREFLRGLELSPGYATGHEWYGGYLVSMGRFDEGAAELRRAQELDPLSLMINAVAGVGFYLSRRYDDAIAELRKVLELEPTWAFALAWLGVTLLETGDHEGARAALRKARASATDMAYVLGIYGEIHGRTGYADEAREALALLQQMSHERFVPPAQIANVHLGLGQLDEAFESLDRALAVRDPQLTFGKVNPLWDGLRDDPRFAALLKQIGFEP